MFRRKLNLAKQKVKRNPKPKDITFITDRPGLETYTLYASFFIRASVKWDTSWPQKYWQEILVLAPKVALKFLMSDCYRKDMNWTRTWFTYLCINRILYNPCIDMNNHSNKHNFNTINVIHADSQLHFGVAPSSFQMD